MHGIKKIERVAAYFEVWLDDPFPFAKMRVKVVERASADYLAVANLHLRDMKTGLADPTAGLGATLEEALHDLLEVFFQAVKTRNDAQPISEACFEWAAPEDF